jgi:prophage DNA circulation protein
VPFGVTEEAGSAGRRGRVHEYPFRDTPYAEDLGRRARRYRISAFVLGDDADLQRDQLITACEEKGAGELVHPTLGTLQVQVDPDTAIEWVERWDQGRMIEVRLAFVEPGELQFPTADSDTQAATQSAASDAHDATGNDYVAETDRLVAAGAT